MMNAQPIANDTDCGTELCSQGNSSLAGFLVTSADPNGVQFCNGTNPNASNCIHPFTLENNGNMNQYTVQTYGYFSPVLVVFTLVTNTLVCIVLLKKNMRSPTNTLLLAMAVSDTFTGLLPIPSFFYFFTLGNWNDWVPYRWCFAYVCLVDYFPTIFHTASIWLTVALAVQRYIYVCRGLKAKRWCNIPNAIKVVIGVYIAAVISQFCRFVEAEYVPINVPSRLHNGDILTCYVDYIPIVQTNMSLYYNIYYWFRIIFIHLVPCTSLVVLNALLIMAMRRAQWRRKQLMKQNRQSESRRLKDNNCTTLMLIAVVGVFLLVEFPLAIFLILYTIQNTFETELMEFKTSSEAAMFINIFILLSYPVNFFIYCGMSRQFRETFKGLFKPGGLPVVDREHSQYMSLATENGGKTMNITTATNETAM